VRAKPRHPQRNVGAEPQRVPERRSRSSGDTERQIAPHHGSVMTKRVETGLTVPVKHRRQLGRMLLDGAVNPFVD